MTPGSRFKAYWTSDAEDVGFDGFLGGPAEEVGEEDEAGHGIEFLGGSAESVAEVLGQFADGHDFEEACRKTPCQPLPMILPAGGRNDPLEGVEEAVLSGVDGMDHGGRNSLFQRYG